jgi:hypothetical protein
MAATARQRERFVLSLHESLEIAKVSPTAGKRSPVCVKTLVGESGCRASSSACPAFCLPHGGEFISYLNPTLDKGANQTIGRATFFTTHGLIQDGGHYAVRVSFGEGTGGDVLAEPQSFYFVCRTVARKLRRTL